MTSRSAFSDSSAPTNGPDSTPLCAENLERIGSNVPVPTYNRSAIKCGIMHMSVGGFHRAHQAVYLDDLLNTGDQDWAICGVGLLPSDKDNISALQNQDGLYTVLDRNAARDSARVIGSMTELLHAPSNPAAVLERMKNPDIRILSLTITEKGYYYNTSGDLDENHPAIQNDLKNKGAPQTAYGYIIAALSHRKTEGMKPFTVMSCDNLPGNGHLTKRLVLQFANLVDTDLAAWIESHVSFPNAMVDRITPATTRDIQEIVAQEFNIKDAWPVVCEDFKQWVLEDDFCNGRPPLENVGVQLVSDVDPYEKMKVRLLNGSHSALSYISYLMGYRQVDKAMADPLISKFVRKYMDQDITPSIPDVPGINLDTYKDKLIERFSNPAIADQVQRLAEDGSQKIPNAILPCVRHQLEHGGSIQYAALALAAWFTYLTGVDEKLNPIEIKDPMADKLQSRMKLDSRDPMHILRMSEIFGSDLSLSARFVSEVKAAMQSLYENGTKQTLEEYLS